jgi:CrcB protein
MNYLLVFVGGGLGATFRHGINILCARIFAGRIFRSAHF